MDPDLRLKDVSDRLAAYGNDSVTGHLFYLGEILINELIERTGQIESKAIAALGFSVGGLAFLLFDSTAAASLFVGGMRAIAGIALFCAAMNAYRASSPRAWRWISDATWFPTSDELGADDTTRLLQIRQSHLRELFEIRREMHAANEEKASMVRSAERLLLVAASCLLVAVFADLLS